MYRADIANRQDIELLVKSFYTKAMSDEIIGHFFTEVVKLDLDIHIPRICDFWETILFGTLNFKGDPMSAHLILHKKSELSEIHFIQWLQFWDEAVDSLFNGPKAEEAKLRAKSIAGIMKHKIDQIQ